MFADNPILLTDSYKVTHWKQYPPKTEHVYSYFESRGGFAEESVFYGLSYLLQRYLCRPVIAEDIAEAYDFFAKHFGDKTLFNVEGWKRLVEKHGGYLPLEIKAVPEGSVIPVHNVLMTVENTDPEFYWLTNYVETLLVQVWYPMTVATLSREMRKLILKYLKLTGDPAGIDFKLHDFGFRGVSSVESAGLGASAHLLNSKGTDTLAGILLAQQYYKAGMIGFSIPAAEHSTITSWGKDNEAAAYENMLKQYPEGLVAVVSDSYDINNAVQKIWGELLKEQVTTRNGIVVIRPDSGYPPNVVFDVVRALGDKFGFTTNSNGYKVLNSKVRVIQGDGINYDMTRNILHNLYEHRWSTDNVFFGMGGALLQQVNRDTLKCAFKASHVVIDGKGHDVHKEPITDIGKKSKPGKLALVRADKWEDYSAQGVGQIVTVPQEKAGNYKSGDLLQTVFRNGIIQTYPTWDEVSKRAAL